MSPEIGWKNKKNFQKYTLVYDSNPKGKKYQSLTISRTTGWNHLATKQIPPNLTPYAKINFRWIKDLNVSLLSYIYYLEIGGSF